jgi:aspartate aminotransferase
MPIAQRIKEALGSQSMIRKMFEEGIRLRKEHGADKVFDFSLGNPDIEPPPAFHRVFLRLAKEDRRGSHGYMPNAGYPEVREALAAKASREQGVQIDGSHVVMAVGAAGGLNVVFKSILDPGDEVVVPRPYFMEYRSYVANHGGVLVEVDSREDFSLDLGAMRAALSPKTKAVLINSPHNPTGRVYPAADIGALGTLLAEQGPRRPYLVSDEPYREISYDGIAVPPILSSYDESIVVSSYSKSLSLPGERIGYVAVGPRVSDKEDLINALIYATRILGFVNAPALMQRIVAELSFAKVDVEIYARRRAVFTGILDEAGITYARPEGAFYLFCRVPPRSRVPQDRVPEQNRAPGQGAAGDDKSFVEHLKQYLILGVPGSGFGKPGWIRLAYCVDEKIIKASGGAFKKALEAW